MDINIREYLDDNSLKEIAEQEFRNRIYKEFSSESETKRITSNLCYQFVWDMMKRIIICLTKRLRNLL